MVIFLLSFQTVKPKIAEKKIRIFQQISKEN